MRNGNVAGVVRVRRWRCPSSSKTVVECLAGGKSVLELGVCHNRFDKLSARFFPAWPTTLPFNKVCLCNTSPISSEVEEQCFGVRVVDNTRLSHLASRIYTKEGFVGINDLAYQVTSPLITTRDIVKGLTVDWS